MAVRVVVISFMVATGSGRKGGGDVLCAIGAARVRLRRLRSVKRAVERIVFGGWKTEMNRWNEMCKTIVESSRSTVMVFFFLFMR
jgi:hypothetical protein